MFARLVERPHQLLVNLIEVDPDDATGSTHAVTGQFPVGDHPRAVAVRIIGTGEVVAAAVLRQVQRAWGLREH